MPRKSDRKVWDEEDFRHAGFGESYNQAVKKLLAEMDDEARFSSKQKSTLKEMAEFQRGLAKAQQLGDQAQIDRYITFLEMANSELGTWEETPVEKSVKKSAATRLEERIARIMMCDHQELSERSPHPLADVENLLDSYNSKFSAETGVVYCINWKSKKPFPHPAITDENIDGDLIWKERLSPELFSRFMAKHGGEGDQQNLREWLHIHRERTPPPKEDDEAFKGESTEDREFGDYGSDDDDEFDEDQLEDLD